MLLIITLVALVHCTSFVTLYIFWDNISFSSMVGVTLSFTTKHKTIHKEAMVKAAEIEGTTQLNL